MRAIGVAVERDVLVNGGAEGCMHMYKHTARRS